jgi:Protein of unknown function (DUF3014)
MLGFDDVDLDRSYEDPYIPARPPRSYGWLIGALAVILIAGAVGYTVLKQRARPAPVATAAPQRALDQAPAAVQTPAVVGETVTLPPLAETDSIVREMVGRLSAHAAVAAWLATKGLIANFAVVTLNIADGQLPTQHIRSLAPRGRFQTRGSGAALTIDPRSYDRYNGYAEAIAGVDAMAVARLYTILKPRVHDAYKDLGYPDGDFDRVLERAIGQLLNVPVVEGSVALRPKVLAYAYADPRLESLSPVQRQFLRMGPQNVQTVQAKLREIATLLSLHPEAASRISSR